MSWRIFVFDRYGIQRTGLTYLLEGEDAFEVVGQTGSQTELFEQIQSLRPDILLLDIDLPGTDGLDNLRQATEKSPGLRVLVMTYNSDSKLLIQAMQAGACGFLLYSTTQQELLTALFAAARGDLYIHSSMTRKVLQNTGALGQSGAAVSLGQLTRREREILHMIGKGHSYEKIAKDLEISKRTVLSHRAMLMAKLNKKSFSELKTMAIEFLLKMDQEGLSASRATPTQPRQS